MTRFDRIESSEYCRTAMSLLDYNATKVSLESLAGETLSDRVVMSALAPRRQRGSYSPKEQAVRDAFDNLFSELDRLGAMVSAGLISNEDLEPFAGYWLNLFDPIERNRSDLYTAILRRYVRGFNFRGLARLLEARGLMFADGSRAVQQALHDDQIITRHNEAWAAPEPVNWLQRLK